MNQAVRNLITFTHCSIAEAIETATLHPAHLLGIQNSKGTLSIGSNADFLLLNQDLEVKACYIAGIKQSEAADAMPD